MKKFMLHRPGIEKAVNIEKIALLEHSGDGLVLRYFSVALAVPSDVVPASEVPAANITEWVNYTPLGAAGVYVKGSAFPEVPALKNMVLQELERQMFSPQAISDEKELGNAEMYDFAAIVFPASFEGKAQVPYNHFVEGKGAKASVRRVGRLRGKLAFLILTAVQVESPLSEWTLLRSEHPLVEFVDRTPGVWKPFPETSSILSVFPSVMLTAPNTVGANGAIVEVSVKNADGSAYSYSGDFVVEALAGYVSKQRVTIENGQGTFKVIPLGLEAGDKIRVKVGTRTISGLAETEITVA